MDVQPEEFRAARAMLGLDQDGMAALIGISTRSASSIETGSASLSLCYAFMGFCASAGVTFVSDLRQGTRGIEFDTARCRRGAAGGTLDEVSPLGPGRNVVLARQLTAARHLLGMTHRNVQDAAGLTYRAMPALEAEFNEKDGGAVSRYYASRGIRFTVRGTVLGVVKGRSEGSTRSETPAATAAG